MVLPLSRAKKLDFLRNVSTRQNFEKSTETQAQISTRASVCGGNEASAVFDDQREKLRKYFNTKTHTVYHSEVSNEIFDDFVDIIVSKNASFSSYRMFGNYFL